MKRVKQEAVLRENCSYVEFFWFVFSRLRTEYGEIVRISPYSVRMRENTDQKNCEYWHFSLSAVLHADRSCSVIETCPIKIWKTLKMSVMHLLAANTIFSCSRYFFVEEKKKYSFGKVLHSLKKVLLRYFMTGKSYILGSHRSLRMFFCKTQSSFRTIFQSAWFYDFPSYF